MENVTSAKEIVEKWWDIAKGDENVSVANKRLEPKMCSGEYVAEITKFYSVKNMSVKPKMSSVDFVAEVTCLGTPAAMYSMLSAGKIHGNYVKSSPKLQRSSKKNYVKRRRLQAFVIDGTGPIWRIKYGLNNFEKLREIAVQMYVLLTTQFGSNSIPLFSH